MLPVVVEEEGHDKKPMEQGRAAWYVELESPRCGGTHLGRDWNGARRDHMEYGHGNHSLEESDFGGNEESSGSGRAGARPWEYLAGWP